MQKYPVSDVYDEDEAGLFYEMLPAKTLDLKGEQCYGNTQSKKWDTVQRRRCPRSTINRQGHSVPRTGTAPGIRDEGGDMSVAHNNHFVETEEDFIGTNPTTKDAVVTPARTFQQITGKKELEEYMGEENLRNFRCPFLQVWFQTSITGNM